MFTLVSRASMLGKLAQALREENEPVWSSVGLLIDDVTRRWGVEGVRQTIADVRAGRIHTICIEWPAGPRETFKVNYWASGGTWK